MKTLIETTSNKLVKAFLNNKIIAPIPSKFSKKINEAQKLRKLCESKINEPVIGFKAAGTGIPLIKKFKEKEPFYASVYKRNLLKNLTLFSSVAFLASCNGQNSNETRFRW